MPTYDYECRECGHTLEVFQKVNEAHLLECPNCKANALFRVLTGGLGFSIKGRTVGAIADKNTDKFSDDYKHHLASKTEKIDVLSQQGFEPASKKEKNLPKMSASEKKIMRKLANATEQQKQSYIKTGII